MAGNPQISQGTLNRLRASITVASNPGLNVTSPYVGKDGISFNPEGNATTMISTQTGMVVSPEPFIEGTLTIHLLRTQGLAAQYRAQMESNSAIGNLTIRPDAVTLPDYNLVNCAIVSVRELPMAGQDAGYTVTIRGTYYINNDLWGV